MSSAALRLFFAWRYPGFLNGDDLEIVAAAARWSAGLRYTPWSIRSLVHPLLLVFPVQKTGALLGLTGPRGLTVLACLPTIAFSTAAILVLHRVARASGLGETTSGVAAFLYAFHWMPLTYGSTPYPRPISTCLLLLALLVLQRAPGRAAPAFAAGLLAAGAFAVRWSEGAFLVVLAVYAAATSRRPRAVLALLAGGFTGALALVGGFDALTRGSAFESLRAFLEFHRDQTANGSHVRAWFWYGSMLLQWAGPVLIVLLILAWPKPGSRVWIAIAASFAVILSFSGLKELRYLQVCIPFLCVAGAIGWERLRAMNRAGDRAAGAVLVLAAALGLARTVQVLRSKSASAIQAAEYLASLPGSRSVVLEQEWAYGDRLYLGNDISIADVRPSRPLRTGVVAPLLGDADAAAFYERDVSEGLRRELGHRGFRPGPTFSSEASEPVWVFLRRRPATEPASEIPRD